MPDLWMDVDTALTEVPVNILSLIDDTDFKTRETAVAYNAAGMNLAWNFVTTAGVFSQTPVTPTNAGDYDWVSQGDGMYAIEMPASGGGSINNDTEGVGWFTGIATGILPWRGPTIGFRAAALNNSLIDAGTTGLLAPTVAARTLDVSTGGEAGVDWANVGSPTTTLDLSGTSTKALEPTTAGRKLDVTTTGEAGIDWANIGAPTTTVNLSGTTVKTATDVETDTQDIQARLPAALVSGRIDASVGAMASGVITATSIAADAIGASELAADAASEIATAVRTELTTELGRIDAAITTRAAAALFTGITSVAQWLGLLAGKQTGNSTARTEIRATGAGSGTFDETTDALEAVRDRGDAAWTTGATAPTAAAIADAVWEETLADHSGTSGSTAAALNAAGSAGDPWNTALPGAYGAGSAGNIIGNNVNATISSRLAPTTVGRTLDVTATGEAGIDWANIGSPTTTVGLSGTTVKTATDVETDTQDIQSRLPAALVSGRIDSSVGAMATDVVTAAAIAADAIGSSELAATAVNEIADQVWDEVLSGHLTSGTTGAALNGASSAGDPWTTALPGAYGAGTAGKIVGDNLNATVGSRATQTSVDDVPTNAELATALAAADDAVLAAIAALNNLSAAQVTAAVPTAVQNADALLKRDFSAVTGEAARSALNALRFLRNRFQIAGGTLTVYGEDDTTAKWTGAVTQTAGDPVSQIDPA